MRSQVFGLIFVVGWLAQGAMAGDEVGYDLDATRFEVPEIVEDAEPSPMTIEDHVWSTPGVEEWTTQLAEAGVIELDFKFPTDVEESSQDGPRFFDGYIWPRTREMFHPRDFEGHVFSFVLAASN